MKLLSLAASVLVTESSMAAESELQHFLSMYDIASQITVVAGVTYLCYQLYKNKRKEYFSPSEFFIEVQTLRNSKDFKKLSKMTTKQMLLAISAETESFYYSHKDVSYDFTYFGEKIMEINYTSDEVDEVWVIVWEGQWLLAGITIND